jgi:hypothetical protein
VISSWIPDQVEDGGKIKYDGERSPRYCVLEDDKMVRISDQVRNGKCVLLLERFPNGLSASRMTEKIGGGLLMKTEGI